MRKAYWIVVVVIGVLLIGVYKSFAPAEYAFFPKCPFLLFSGFRCPGCGSQRALHELFNMHFAAAFQQNMLLVISAPYILTGMVIENIKNPSARLLQIRQHIFGGYAVWVVLVIVVSFWILRNIPCFSPFF